MKIRREIVGYFGLIIYIILPILLNDIIAKFFNFHNFWALNIVNLIAPTLTSIVLIGIYWPIIKDKWQDFKTNWRKYLPLMIKYWLVGFVLMLLTNTIISSITNNIALNEAENRTLFYSLPLFSIISTIFLAPICEELIFRGAFKNILRNKYVFCFFTAILFGLLHVAFQGDYIFIIPYAALGFMLALAYYETDNIFVSISMHAWHNFLCILVLFLGGL